MKRLADLIPWVLPALTGVGFLMVAGTGNLFMILPMGGAMVASIGFSFYAAFRAGEQRK